MRLSFNINNDSWIAPLTYPEHDLFRPEWWTFIENFLKAFRSFSTKKLFTAKANYESDEWFLIAPICHFIPEKQKIKLNKCEKNFQRREMKNQTHHSIFKLAGLVFHYSNEFSWGKLFPLFTVLSHYKFFPFFLKDF